MTMELSNHPGHDHHPISWILENLAYVCKERKSCSLVSLCFSKIFLLITTPCVDFSFLIFVSKYSQKFTTLQISDGRICGEISVSRAFGDIRFKTKKNELVNCTHLFSHVTTFKVLSFDCMNSNVYFFFT